MEDPGRQVRLAVWHVPECPIRISYPPALLHELGQLGGEGVLFGEREAGVVRIRAFRQEGSAREEAVWERAGWYRIQSSGAIGLSGADLEKHRRQFPEPWQIALVMRAGLPGPMRAGFFCRGSDGFMPTEECRREFLVDPALVRAEPEAPVSRPPAVPAFVSAQPAAHRANRAWLPLLIVLLFGGGFFAGRAFWRETPAPAEPAPLVASEREGQIRIQWDQSARTVREAVSGVLEIADGESRASVVLAPAQLRGGSFTYVRQSPRVDVRLVLQQPGGGAVEQVATFLGYPPKN